SVLAGSCLILIIAAILTRDILHKRKINRVLNKKNIRIEKQRNEIKKQKREIEKKNHKLKEFNKELLKENVYARYEVLKSKVNPHFLFNSLSTLATLI